MSVPYSRQPLKLGDLLRCRELTRILRTDPELERAHANACDDFIRTDSHTAYQGEFAVDRGRLRLGPVQ